MAGLIAASSGSAWSYGGAILTFAFPMILFIAVAGGLYVLYTKPHMVPGHRYQLETRPASATGAVKMPSQDRPAGAAPVTEPGLGAAPAGGSGQAPGAEGTE